jgi:hypothetical protein
VTIEEVDTFEFGSAADEAVVRIDKFARAVLGGELVCSIVIADGGLGMLTGRLVRFPIVGLGLLLA